MKRREPQSIAQIMQEAMSRIGRSDSFDELRLADRWPDVVGPGINRMTERRYVSNGVLHVYLTSAALKGELMCRRQALVDALNATIGRIIIRDIAFH